MDPKTIKRGDNLVYHNRVLKVLKIRNNKVREEKEVVAKPHFVTRKGLETKFSIPFSAFEVGNVRKLMSKTAVEKLMRTLQHDTIHDGEKIAVISRTVGINRPDIYRILKRVKDGHIKLSA